MRSLLEKLRDRLKLCCCFCITDDEARIVDESRPIIVKMKKDYEHILEQSLSKDRIMFQNASFKVIGRNVD